MKSRAPISGLDRPSRASRAIWASWGGSSTVTSTVRLRAVSPAAASSPRALPAPPTRLCSVGGRPDGDLDAALAGGLAGGRQLATGPLGERPDAHRV